MLPGSTVAFIDFRYFQEGRVELGDGNGSS